MSSRKFFVGGNWKMNGDKASIAALSGAWKGAEVNPEVEVVIGCPPVYIEYLRSQLREDFHVAGENCYKAEKGAYTGEVSPQMLLDCGASWVIIGHSERRDIFGESSELIAEKCAYSIKCGLPVIACIGEHLEEREKGTTMEVCASQLKAIAGALSAEQWKNVVIAYEPVWAIGTGKVATPQQAQDTHRDIRTWLEANVSKQVAEQTRILYGGSVTPGNSADLARCPDIDGFLVGGASLKADFLTIVNSSK